MKAEHAIAKRGYMNQPATGHYIDCRCGRAGGLFGTKEEATADYREHADRLAQGNRVRSGAAAGGTYGQCGVITTGKATWMDPGKVYIRWDGNFMSSGYAPDSEIVECLQEDRP